MLTAPPVDIGINPDRYQYVIDLVESWCRPDETGISQIPGAALIIGRHGKTPGVELFGRQSDAPDAPPIRSDSIFLVASLTKPVVASAILRLVEQGHLTLDERVEEFLPGFGKHGKHAVTIRHLLSHTSGLPDMLPTNQVLRAANAPLSEFVSNIHSIGLDFVPGRSVQYQSMGFAVLGEIIRVITGKTAGQFLNDDFFQPMRMFDTVLGAPDSWFEGPNPNVDRIAGLRMTDEQIYQSHWNWHSRYWRQLGAPWGGLLTTPNNLGRFAMMWLQGGELEYHRYLSPTTVAAATRNQLESMKEVPEDDRRCRPWGLGWRLNWLAHSANFGDLLSTYAYGHWGATGTAMWIDPVRDAFCVFLTTLPQEPHGRYLSRLSNAVCAAFE